ncbi:hypothetical protein PHMEG_00010142 [Phytophthora megakarya]|uniref:Integrase catalytic domain-containing protein n=1 Tax=Phytophthora megakarya TaxID=4795 RepID=A0A225WEG3_9STRA|nr:hypothetical protein PHMEG_00010142 [Phytophthora megakarya]
MDFVFGLPRDTQVRTGTLVFVDRFSKMVHLTPVSVNITAEPSAAIFVDIVYRHHGLPISIVSDRGPRFTAVFWTQLFKLLGKRLKVSTASHPEADGQTERANRVVEDAMRCFATSFKSWSLFLQMVELAMNNLIHASTGLTPFYVKYGRQSRVPVLLGVERFDTTNEVDVEGANGSAPRGALEIEGTDEPGYVTPTLRPTTNDPVPRGSVSASDESRESAHDAVNGLTTHHAARAAAQGVCTRASARAAVEEVAGGTTRDRVATRNSSLGIPDADKPTSSSTWNQVPRCVGRGQDIRVKTSELQPRSGGTLRQSTNLCKNVNQSCGTCVRSGQPSKEYADRRGRKNLEKVAVGDRVLLSTAGIQPAAVTNLGANKLAPRFTG